MDKLYSSVEEQVNYKLESISENRKAEVSVRDLVYIHNTIGEMIRFFHNRMHYRSLSEVHEITGSKDAGVLSLLAECYYYKLSAMLPEDIQDGFDDGTFDNPNAPYYYPRAQQEESRSES